MNFTASSLGGPTPTAFALPLATGAQGEPRGRADSRAQTRDHSARQTPRSLERTCRCARSRRRTPPARSRSSARRTTRLGDYHTRHVPPGSPRLPHSPLEWEQPTRLRSAETHRHRTAPQLITSSAERRANGPWGHADPCADRMHSWARHAHTSLKRESARVDAVSRTASEECG